jgi:hypothetical protein
MELEGPGGEPHRGRISGAGQTLFPFNSKLEEKMDPLINLINVLTQRSVQHSIAKTFSCQGLQILGIPSGSHLDGTICL